MSESSNVAERARWIMFAGAAFVIVLLLYAVFVASHWQLVHDAPLMHYIVFLMSKGFVPYRDIIDMNMPGSYMEEGFAMHLLGGGARGWFLWDAMSLLTAVLASAWIAGPSKRAAGVVAGVVACLFHLSDGAWNLGQRDWIVTVLLLLSFGCLFHALRGGRTAWIIGVTLFAGLAASIKPPALLFPVLALVLVCWKQRQTFRQISRTAAWAFVGLLPSIAAGLLFLAKWHAGSDFLAVSHGLVPYYASLGKVGFEGLFGANFGRQADLLGLLACLALVLFWMGRSWHSLESLLLLLGAFCGLAVYILQAKGFTYHRYPAVAFFALWVALEAERGLRNRGPRLWLALVVFTGLVVALPIVELIRERSNFYPTSTMNHLEADLTRMGGSQLSGHVQCLDMTLASCINVLYRLQIVQSTGFIYDFYLFPERPTPLSTDLQNRFYDKVTADPPRVFVLSDQYWPGVGHGYDHLNRFPRLNDLLTTRYKMVEDYVATSKAASYRLYALR